MIELGVLLGQYDGAQSFEQVGSWSVGAYPLTTQTTNVHSSSTGGKIIVPNSTAPVEVTQYNYAAANDGYLKWSSEVSSHRFITYAWARLDVATESGHISWVGPTGALTTPKISYATTLQRYRLETFTSSTTNPAWAFQVNATNANTYQLFLDDLVNAVDVIDLDTAGWDVRGERAQSKVVHTALGKAAIEHHWGDWGKWELPVQYLPDSHMILLNRWWANGWNLLFSLDTSDTAQQYICRIANTESPITQLQPPYPDLWQGRIILEAVTNGLSF